jgi:serine/threonine-protein kinase HipA
MADVDVDVVVVMGNENVRAGRLYSHRRRGQESSTFAYADDYLKRDGAYPLDPALPLHYGALQTPTGVPLFCAFADTAPDRWGRTLLMRAEKYRAEKTRDTRRSFGEVDFLLGVRDDLRQGALRFRDVATDAYLANETFGVPHLTDLPTLLTAAAHAERDTADYGELSALLRAGSSLGGARPKAHVIDAAGRIAIAKFPSAEYDTWNVTAWEKVALDLARQAGIRVPDTQLLRISGRSVLIVDRFDRDGDRRIGYISAMSMLEASDGDVGSYLDIAAVIEGKSSAITQDLQELWRRIALSILISNTDDHLRNHGFIHEIGDIWRLSPIFDVNPNPDPGLKHLSTAIVDYDTTASISNLISVAGFFRLGVGEAKAILGEVLEAVAHWRVVAATHGLSESEITKMRPAFEHPEAQTAAALVSG